jgi:hypothetical protein
MKQGPSALYLDLFDPGWRERDAAHAALFLSSIPVIEPLAKIGKRVSPCGECIIQPGERCDVCGARQQRSSDD